MKPFASLLSRLLASAFATVSLLAPAFGADPAASAAAAASAAPAAPVAAAAQAKPDIARGQQIATQVCQACHAMDGSRGIPVNPILQGQLPEYIVKQLTEFKAGKRVNPIMSGMAATLTDSDMRSVALFYASKQAQPGAAKDKELAALGERIYRGGIADRQVPACAGCHTPNGAGIPAQYPRVSGQNPDYTEAQLIAFRAGARTNGPMMLAIAAKLNDREIKAVTDFMAGLH
jgi:cytochrome c553